MRKFRVILTGLLCIGLLTAWSVPAEGARRSKDEEEAPKKAPRGHINVGMGYGLGNMDLDAGTGFTMDMGQFTVYYGRLWLGSRIGLEGEMQLGSDMFDFANGRINGNFLFALLPGRLHFYLGLGATDVTDVGGTGTMGYQAVAGLDIRLINMIGLGARANYQIPDFDSLSTGIVNATAALTIFLF